MAPPQVTGRKPVSSNLRLLSYPDLKLKGIGFSRSELRRREHAGTFPQRLKLGEGRNPTVAWVEHEIDDWIVSRMAARGSLGATP
jgi:predicted DNA-binding transcriptional regulator AlpA